MSLTTHRYSLISSVLVSILLLSGCNHDSIPSKSDAEPTASMPTEPVATTPTVPEASTPAEPAELPPTVPEPSTPAEPTATPPAEPVVSTPSEPKAKDTLTLKPGQSGKVAAGTTLHYVRLVNDSRCPAGAQCIWAGEVTIELMLDSGKEKQTFTMKDDEKPASVLGYTIELLSIDRGHLINVRVKKV